MPHKLPNDLRLRILGNKEVLGKSQFGWRHSLSSRYKTLAIVVKKYAKMDIKLLMSCPLLPDFSILFQIFFPRLSDEAKFWS